MTRWTLAIAIVLSAVAAAFAPAGAQEQEPVRFTYVDLYLDSGETDVAAWQLEFAAELGSAVLVGVEGGDHPAFAKPPVYDPKALNGKHGGRIIIAAYSLEEILPAGRTRVARLHLQVTGPTPQFVTKLQAASDREGERIGCTVDVRHGE